MHHAARRYGYLTRKVGNRSRDDAEPLSLGRLGLTHIECHEFQRGRFEIGGHDRGRKL